MARNADDSALGPYSVEAATLAFVSQRGGSESDVAGKERFRKTRKKMAPALNAVVVQKSEISPGLCVLRVAPRGGELADFIAGQFAVLGLPGDAPRVPMSEEEDEPASAEKLIRRAYSIASPSVAKEYLEFYITLVPSGALSPRLFALGIGDEVWLGPKFSGLFTLDDVPGDQHVILCSTGTGLAPYLSMLQSHLVCGGPRRFAVLHGARHSWELGYRSELLMLKRMCSNFNYVASISRPGEEPVEWTGESGYVQEVWQRDRAENFGFEPTPENTHVFLCGNPKMVETMVEVLGEQGYREHSTKSPGQIHVERYW